ncbi:MAG: DUF177 domain-containing protein [Clostridiales bacterium]|nr:DUF177 domain-containing protein [Clostridiales bacterium]
MLINLSELFDSDGKEKTWTAEPGMDVFEAPNGAYPVLRKSPVELTICSLGGRKFRMRGEASLTLSIPCDRCLEPVECPFDLAIDEEFEVNGADAEHGTDPDAQHYVDGYILDVDQLLRNELLLSLPMKVLCREDCRGVCNQCGMNLNTGTCSCEQSSPDPRMAAVQDIFQKFKEV